METKMSANYPILPLGGSALIRGFASLLAFLIYWLKELARARRHRREANLLAGLFLHLLPGIGLTPPPRPAALFVPFFGDPTTPPPRPPPPPPLHYPAPTR